jgi:hypothetical protein
MGAISSPAETPFEMARGLADVCGDTTEILGPLVLEPELRDAGSSLVIPGPTRVVAGASLAFCGRWSDGRTERVAAMGIVVLVLDDVVDGWTCWIGTGGFGGSGMNTGRASMRDVSRSGCSSGSTTRVAATAH